MKGFGTMRTHILFGLVILPGILLLASCGSSAPDASAPARAVAVNVIRAAYAAVPNVILAPGTVRPRNRIPLSAQINGFVRDVQVRAGDDVRAGQILATLDAREAESQKAAAAAAVAESEAALDEARKASEVAASMRNAARASAELASSTLERYQKLFGTKSVSPQELDEVRTRRDAAAADLEAKETMVAAAEDRLRQVSAKIGQAKAQANRVDVILSWTVIKAPESGRVAARMVDPGSAIFPGSPILVLESAGNPQVVADIPENQSRHLRKGMEVVVAGAGDSSGPITGRIAEIVPLSDTVSHTVQFKVDLPQGTSLQPGRFVTIGVPAGSRQALLISRQALRENGQLTGVYIVDGASMARYRLVKAAPYGSDRIELLSGIAEGEEIIENPAGGIQDGTPLEVRR